MLLLLLLLLGGQKAGTINLLDMTPDAPPPPDKKVRGRTEERTTSANITGGRSREKRRLWRTR
jgi:hypothetical protein